MLPLFVLWPQHDAQRAPNELRLAAHGSSFFWLWLRCRAVLLALFALAFSVFLPPQVSPALDFSFEKLPAERPHENLAWHDVNGDGRKDFVCQSNRLLEVFLLGDHHHVEQSPAWRVEIASPWDLWDFAEVRADLPGEELLALSPNGLGWLSFGRGTTSTAKMEMLIAEDLPVRWDERKARPGQIALQLRQDRPACILLPTRRGFRVYHRAKDFGRWEGTEEIIAPLRPFPQLTAHSSVSYLTGFGSSIPRRGLRTLSSPVSGQLAEQEYRFRINWYTMAGQFLDWNGDGRLDWIVENQNRSEDKVQICLQDTEGRFDREHPVALRLPWESDDDDENGKNNKKNRPRDLRHGLLPDSNSFQWENLADVNGDGRLDLVRVSTLNDWSAPKTRVAVYLQGDDGTFPSKPDSLIRVRAVIPSEGLPFSDVDGDGDLDLFLLGIDLQAASVNSHVKAFFGKGLKTSLGAYLWKERSGLMNRPAWEKSVVISHDMFAFTRDPQPLMQFDRDLTGDGRPDLVLRMSRNTVGVFPMGNDKKGFVEIPVVLQSPFTVEKMECRDIDGDGKIDIYVEGWDGNEPNRVSRGVFFAQANAKGSR